MRRRGSLHARFWRAQDGAAVVEYALIAAIVCCALAVGVSLLAGSISDAVNLVAVCVQDPSSCLGSG